MENHMSDDYLTSTPFDVEIVGMEEVAVMEEPPGNPRSIAVASVPVQTTLDGTVAAAITAPDDLPYALAYQSKSGKRDHQVIIQANGGLTCTCWPGITLLPRGCHAMQSARALLGLPLIEGG